MFLTGTSSSGKTTLYESLRQDESLADIDFHDIDENGVPSVGRGPWRAYRVEQLLYNAIKTYEAGTSTVVCGITMPHEVIESRYYNERYRVYFLLAQTTEQLIRERLLMRADAQSSGDTYDESFDPSNIERTIRENFELRTALHNSVINQRNGFEIDASELSKKAMHDHVKNIITSIQEN